ncbi:MAG TPA: hypothetical protein VFV75_08290 [Candidatus Polarisedimenticolaceae bacterium]|nr:hypothetical protein [Candidatus Polarisedimenticolaceae bacterium]
MIEDLRGPFLDRSGVVPPCPPAEALWDAAHGRGDRAGREAIAAHLAACPACASSWRLAQELREQPMAAPAGGGRLGSRLLWALAAVAAGAVLLVSPLRERFREGGTEAPVVYRAPGAGEPVSEISDLSVLPREAFVLRWSGGPPGTRWDLEVSDASLRPLHQAGGLTAPTQRVPADALASLPSGATVLWQVRARLPDGRVLVSETWRARLE